MLHSPKRMGLESQDAPAQAEPQQSAELQFAPYQDAAKHIIFDHIRRVGGVNFKTAAELWDLYHDAKSSAELAGKLKDFPVASELKHSLFLAKAQHEKVVPKTWRDRLDAAVDVVHRVAKLPSKHLEVSEKHPLVTKIMAEAILKEKEKE